ncbi:MAG TPA: FAD-binding oxidoreductase [Candidatus Dormibacteraeota bacterium]|nr:FAD-binding oxidoreductase [Candidatus Dormibacteraeota bacterium]
MADCVPPAVKGVPTMAIARAGLADLRERARGRLITPDHPAFDASRRTFNAMAGGRPLAILQPDDTADIVAAVRWAGDADVGIGVRGGGHSVAGHSAPDGALLIDLSSWRGAEVDPAGRTAVALGGSRLMDLDVATAAYGLAAPSGTFVDTGIGGLTLGGGISYLVASEGFACDALIGAELVTAAGEVIAVDESLEPELLWALRGGGGNFGVVTRLRYRLTDVSRIAGGRLDFRGDGIGRVLGNLVALERQAPDALTVQALARRWPEDRAPGLTLLVTWRGEAADGAAAVADLVADRSRIAGDIRATSWLQVQAVNAPIPFGLRHYWKGHLVHETPSDLVDAVLDAIDEIDGRSVVLLELIHGVAHRIDAASAAFGGRAAVANARAIAIWGSPADDEAQIGWARRTAARIEPFSLRGGGYLNYGELDQSASRVAAGFGPEAFERLRRMKSRYDPANRFRFNANIPPAAS